VETASKRNAARWPMPLRASIADLAATYIRSFRRDAEARLRKEFPDLDRDEIDRIVQAAAERSWTEFEENDLTNLIEELGGLRPGAGRGDP
jgi:lauroyl/myristoyl acyltransferase